MLGFGWQHKIVRKKESTKMSEPQSSWTLKIAEVQEVACVLQFS